jgi:hypothetical protein
MRQLKQRVERLQKFIDLNAADVILADAVVLVQDAAWMAFTTEMGDTVARKQHEAVSSRVRLCWTRECSNQSEMDGDYCQSCSVEGEVVGE